MENHQTYETPPETPQGFDGSAMRLRFGPRPPDENVHPGLRNPCVTANTSRRPLHPLLRGRVIRSLARERDISSSNNNDNSLRTDIVIGQSPHALPRRSAVRSRFVRTRAVVDICPGPIEISLETTLGDSSVLSQIPAPSHMTQVQLDDPTDLDSLVAAALHKENHVDNSALDSLATTAVNDDQLVDLTIPCSPARQQFLSSMQGIMGPEFMAKWKLLEGTEMYEKIITRGISYRWSRWTVTDKEIMWDLKRRGFRDADIGLILGRTQMAICQKLQEI